MRWSPICSRSARKRTLRSRFMRRAGNDARSAGLPVQDRGAALAGRVLRHRGDPCLQPGAPGRARSRGTVDPARCGEGGMSAPHTREVDPVTGHDTTGHDWNGIKELNTPFPRIVIWALVLTFLYSVVAWILLPAWPTGRDYTRGLLGLDQGGEAVAGYRALSTGRQGWLDRFAAGDFAALQADAAL